MAEGTRAAAPAVVDHTDLSGVGTLADLGGGKERTHAEFDALLHRGGFRLESVAPCPPSGYSVLRARPA
jgi:hypothetical protein